MKTVPREKPLAAQIFGTRPEWMARAARMLEDRGADLIDLNLGCPARKVTRNGAGAALLKDFDLIRNIVSSVRRAVAAPLTVKTRLGWEPGGRDVFELAPMLADLGVNALTLHARWASQGFSGRADWDQIARLADIFPGPVIGNGDVTSPEAALNMLDRTGCAGVMIGRAALGSPWIFSQSLSLLAGKQTETPDLAERFAAARKHALSLGEHVGFGRAVYMLRSVLMWYTKGLPNSSGFRAKINQIRDFSLLLDMIAEYQCELETRDRQLLEAAV